MGLQDSAEAGTDQSDSRQHDATVHHHVEELDDNRDIGEWKSRFGTIAWLQIAIELAYLVGLLGVGTIALLDTAIAQPHATAPSSPYVSTFLNLRLDPEALKWVALWVAGLMGGAVFALKWLYHSVAHGVWNQDRILWRLNVPFNSDTVSIFTGFLVSSGVIPLLKIDAFEAVLHNLAFGFIFGYFSDNILAALQNFAQKIFGTLGQSD